MNQALEARVGPQGVEPWLHVEQHQSSVGMRVAPFERAHRFVTFAQGNHRCRAKAGSPTISAALAHWRIFGTQLT
jgi:hypothetical protein